MSKYRINIGNKIYEMEIERMDEVAATLEKPVASALFQNTETKSPKLNLPEITNDSKNTSTGGNIVHSPLPGTIIRLCAKNGDQVKRGQAVLVLEAMKMENEITSPQNGIVSGLIVTENQTVQGGAILFAIEE